MIQTVIVKTTEVITAYILDKYDKQDFKPRVEIVIFYMIFFASLLVLFLSNDSTYAILLAFLTGFLTGYMLLTLSDEHYLSPNLDVIKSLKARKIIEVADQYKDLLPVIEEISARKLTKKILVILISKLVSLLLTTPSIKQIINRLTKNFIEIFASAKIKALEKIFARIVYTYFIGIIIGFIGSCLYYLYIKKVPFENLLKQIAASLKTLVSSKAVTAIVIALFLKGKQVSQSQINRLVKKFFPNIHLPDDRLQTYYSLILQNVFGKNIKVKRVIRININSKRFELPISNKYIQNVIHAFVNYVVENFSDDIHLVYIFEANVNASVYDKSTKILYVYLNSYEQINSMTSDDFIAYALFGYFCVKILDTKKYIGYLKAWYIGVNILSSISFSNYKVTVTESTIINAILEISLRAFINALVGYIKALYMQLGLKDSVLSMILSVTTINLNDVFKGNSLKVEQELVKKLSTADMVFNALTSV